MWLAGSRKRRKKKPEGRINSYLVSREENKIREPNLIYLYPLSPSREGIRTRGKQTKYEIRYSKSEKGA